MKKFLAILLLATLVLSGCSLFEKKETALQATQEVNADSILDNQIYEQAVLNKDAGSCDEVLNAATKEECKKVVDALILTDKAVQKMDDSYCEDIKLERYAKNCEELVEGNIEREEENEKAIEQDENNLEIEQQAVDKGDATLCDGITEESRKNACKYNVLANQALQKNDKTICEGIDAETLIADCEKQFE